MASLPTPSARAPARGHHTTSSSGQDVTVPKALRHDVRHAGSRGGELRALSSRCRIRGFGGLAVGRGAARAYRGQNGEERDGSKYDVYQVDGKSRGPAAAWDAVNRRQEAEVRAARRAGQEPIVATVAGPRQAHRAHLRCGDGIYWYAASAGHSRGICAAISTSQESGRGARRPDGRRRQEYVRKGAEMMPRIRRRSAAERRYGKPHARSDADQGRAGSQRIPVSTTCACLRAWGAPGFRRLGRILQFVEITRATQPAHLRQDPVAPLHDIVRGALP